ncbi:MAG: glycosyl transferase group 1 [Gemmataceae bacterium]|nr:glycosyl transferase group 1 [Gemmataceae bacterium]
MSFVRSVTRKLPAAAGLGQLIRKARRRARLFLRGESPRFFFDVHDRDLIDGLLTSNALPPLVRPPHETALTEGDAALGEMVYDLRDDVRREIPLALTPAQRGAYLGWFLRYGRGDSAAGFADVLRALFECDAAPDRGLVRSYLVHPAWQARHPDALTPGGWEVFKQWVGTEYRVTGRWLRRAALPAATPAAGGRGVNVLGLFRYPSGLMQAASGMIDSLATAGVPLSLRDVPMQTRRDGRPRAGFLGLEHHPVTILNTGLDMPVAEAYRLAALYPRPGVYRIAVWWWELDRLPPEWLDRGREVDEIWAPTAFVADAMREIGKPVYLMPPAVELPAFDPLPKAAFGLDPDKFTFLFVFDMSSHMARKNPLGLIRAFRLAFRPDDPVELVLKVNPQERYYAEQWQALRSAAAGAGVKLLDRSLARGELLGLMTAADAYVSLHRSEGFGLTMAEAMLLGKPTIATGYSGNLAFMTPDNSYLVRYERAEIPEDIPPYPKGCVWAEPSVEHAAKLMRRAVADRAEAAAVAARGREEVAALLSRKAAGARMGARLAEVGRA